MTTIAVSSRPEATAKKRSGARTALSIGKLTGFYIVLTAFAVIFMVPYVLAAVRFSQAVQPDLVRVTLAAAASIHVVQLSHCTVPAGLHRVPRQHGVSNGDPHGGPGGLQRYRCVRLRPAQVPRTGYDFLVLPGNADDPQHRNDRPAVHDNSRDAPASTRTGPSSSPTCSGRRTRSSSSGSSS